MNSGLIPHQRSPIPFPWVGLIDLMHNMPRQVLPIVGYGSLISKPSADLTLKQTESSRTPCIVFGCRRLFNYNMPERALDRYHAPYGTKFRAALNVEVTHNPSDMINGILTELHAADVDSFRLREHGYDLVPVDCAEWGGAALNGTIPAFILTAPDRALRPEWQVVRSDILPQPDYLRLCEEGAKTISKAYLDFFRDTTFLADKLTKISSWTPPVA